MNPTKSFELVFDHYAINVSDLGKSVEFYQQILQLKDIPNKTRKDNIHWFSLSRKTELHVIEADISDVQLTKGIHLALTLPNFDEYLEFLKEQSVVFSDWPGIEGAINVRTDGIRQIYFQDPDGYWIEINEVGGKS